MADKKGEQKEKDVVEAPEKVTLLNNGKRDIHTTAGVLAIGKSLAVDADVAKMLMDYPGVVDIAKFAPPMTRNVAELQRTIVKLNRDLAAAKEELAKSEEVIKGLEEEASGGKKGDKTEKSDALDKAVTGKK